jgi:hypothetical protein
LAELPPFPLNDTALAGISSLTNLQALSVNRLSYTSAAGYAALPASLTLLQLKDMKNPQISGRSLATLTQLQHLQLEQIGD